MTLTMFPAARGFQVLGGLMTLVAISLAAISPYCASSLHVQVGAVAIVLDVGAVLMKRGSAGAIPLSLLKVVIVGTTIMLIVSCAPPPLGYAPLIPQGLAQSLLLLSPLPSLLGACMLRFAR